MSHLTTKWFEDEIAKNLQKGSEEFVIAGAPCSDETFLELQQLGYPVSKTNGWVMISYEKQEA